jgi:hypothetical protein
MGIRPGEAQTPCSMRQTLELYGPDSMQSGTRRSVHQTKLGSGTALGPCVGKDSGCDPSNTSRYWKPWGFHIKNSTAQGLGKAF